MVLSTLKMPLAIICISFYFLTILDDAPVLLDVHEKRMFHLCVISQKTFGTAYFLPLGIAHKQYFVRGDLVRESGFSLVLLLACLLE